MALERPPGAITQRRDETAADIAIVARKHRGDASTRRQSY